LLNRYHWFVLTVAALGWLFDTMDQQLFNLARVPAMKTLLKPGEDVALYGGYATAIFLIGWATGGLTFGVLGDRIGRAKTMVWTILVYSLCTGLSAFSVGFWDFAFYRFITGLGVGGEFAVGVSLVAEVMPDRARPYAIGLLQALSALGNITAALISMGLGHLEQSGAIGNAWRWMFVIGAGPALLALLIMRRLKEPERWQAAARSTTRSHLGSYGDLFGNARWRGSAAVAAVFVIAILAVAFFGSSTWPKFTKLKIGVVLALCAAAAGLWTIFSGKGDTRWRRHAVVGMLLACSGVIGLWGIGFFSIDLTRSVFQKAFVAEGMAASKIPGELTFWAGVTSMMLNVGAFFGIYGFGVISQRVGRRLTFAVAFVLALASTVMVFLGLRERSQVFWMMPIMGFCQLSLFGGYAIYFPELFPTRLRSTGISFCYNVGRFVAASGPAVLGLLTSEVYRSQPEPMRYAGVTMCSVFLLGLFVLPFAPETRDKPLPEEEKGVAH
jgi:MFS family permease